MKFQRIIYGLVANRRKPRNWKMEFQTARLKDGEGNRIGVKKILDIIFSILVGRHERSMTNVG